MSFITFNNLLRFEQGIKDVLIQKFGDIASIIGSTTLNTTSQDLTGAINETHDVPLDIQELYKPLIAPLSVSLIGFREDSYLYYGKPWDSERRIFVRVSKTTAMSGTTAIGNIPAGYRPNTDQTLTAYDDDGNVLSDVTVTITDVAYTGTVSVVGSVAPNTYVMASYSPSNPQSGVITKNDIEKLIAENGAVIEKNPNWPNLESSGWKWKKYADGTVEAWYRKQHSVAITAAYEDHFRGEATVAFPFYISGYPVVVASAFTSTDGSGWQTWNAGYSLPNMDTHMSFVLQFYSGSSTTRATAICAHVTGRWK